MEWKIVSILAGLFLFIALFYYGAYLFLAWIWG